MASTSGESSLSASILVLLGALAFGVYQQGGYHEWQHDVFATMVVLAGVVLLGHQEGRSGLSRAALVISPLLTASVLSTLAAQDRTDAASTFLTLALVMIAFAVGAHHHARSSGAGIDAYLAISAIVAVTAIWGVATQTAPWGRITGDVWRGSSSITYANGAAAILGPGLLLGFWKAEQTSSRVYAASSVLLAVGFVSTQSRGGALALVLGAAVLAANLGVRSTLRAGAPIIAATIGGSAGLVAFASVDISPAPILSIALVVAAMLGGAVIWPIRHTHGRHLLVIAGLVAVSGALALPNAFFERVSLRSSTTATGPDGRVLFGDRAKEWSTAWEQFLERPVLGHGPGNVDLVWTEEGRTFMALFVHNEYLELLVTHGLVGAMAIAVSAGFVWRGGRSTEVQAPIRIAVGVFLLHSALDYLWHIPTLPVAMAMLLGLAGHQTTPVGRARLKVRR